MPPRLRGFRPLEVTKARYHAPWAPRPRILRRWSLWTASAKALLVRSRPAALNGRPWAAVAPTRRINTWSQGPPAEATARSRVAQPSKAVPAGGRRISGDIRKIFACEFAGRGAQTLLGSTEECAAALGGYSRPGKEQAAFQGPLFRRSTHGLASCNRFTAYGCGYSRCAEYAARGACWRAANAGDCSV